MPPPSPSACPPAPLPPCTPAPLPPGPPAPLPCRLQTFLQPELLDESDSWYCPGACKAHVRADKKLDLWALPEVLVVHLVRFSNSRCGGGAGRRGAGVGGHERGVCDRHVQQLPAGLAMALSILLT